MEKKHWADKFLLRNFFWFLVLPYRLEQYLKKLEENKSEERE